MSIAVYGLGTKKVGCGNYHNGVAGQNPARFPQYINDHLFTGGLGGPPDPNETAAYASYLTSIRPLRKAFSQLGNQWQQGAALLRALRIQVCMTEE